MQPELPSSGESRLFDAPHRAASKITSSALQQTPHIAVELAGDPRLEPPDRHRDRPGAGRCPGRSHSRRHDRLVRAVSSLDSRDLSVTRTAEILELAGLLQDDPSFTALIQARLAVLAPMSGTGCAPAARRSRSLARNEHTVRQNHNRVHTLLLGWTGHYAHLREVTAADVITATGPLSGSLPRQDPHRAALAVRLPQETGRLFRNPTQTSTWGGDL
jgi:hypothetical protein